MKFLVLFFAKKMIGELEGLGQLVWLPFLGVTKTDTCGLDHKGNVTITPQSQLTIAAFRPTEAPVDTYYYHKNPYCC